MKSLRRRRTELLVGVAVFYIALWLLWLTPVVFPLKLFVVLLHELSHGLAALATGGTIERIVIEANEGGATYTRGGNPFIILTAGYLGSLLWGLLLIELANAKPKVARASLMFMAVTTLLVAALFVRNAFGFMFTLVFGATLFLAARKLGPSAAATILLVLGLTSALYALLDIRSDILARPHLESDAYILGQMTGVHTLVWGSIWVIVAGVACWFAVKRWLRRA